jgi:hypothetical protein
MKGRDVSMRDGLSYGGKTRFGENAIVVGERRRRLRAKTPASRILTCSEAGDLPLQFTEQVSA